MPRRLIRHLKLMSSHLETCKQCKEQLAKGDIMDLCQTGGRLISRIKEGYRRVKQAIMGPSTNAPPQIRDLISQIGNQPIQAIWVCREPIAAAINLALNLISEGRFGQNVAAKGYDSMYHLYMIVQIGTRYIRLEKNQVVMAKDSDDKGNESQAVPFKPGSITLQALIDNAVKRFGASRIWVYDPTNSNNDSGNCQRFIDDLLDASGLNSPAIRSFVLQDADVLSGTTAQIGQKLTNIAARFHVLLNGAGVHKFMNTKNRPPRIY